MSYRDDLEAAQNRIQALEHELGATKKELASEALVVRPRGGLATSPPQRAARRWLGSRTRVRGERVIDGEIDEQTYAELLECITEGFDTAGRSSSVPDRLDWVSSSSNQSGATMQIAISVTHNKGTTRIKGEIRLAGLAGAIFGGLGGGVGGGAVMAPGALFFVNPLLGAAAVGLWLGGTYWACRALYRRSARKRERRLEDVLDQLETIATNAPKRELEPDD